MRMGRFVIDTHVHGQRVAVNFQDREERPDYATLSRLMWNAQDADRADDDAEIVTYRNTDRLLYDMDLYGVDMVCLQPGFGFSDRLHGKMIEEHPDKFVAFAHPYETNRKAVAGEEEWDIDRACEEMDERLSQDGFVGIGEMLPFDPTITDRAERVPWEERHDQLRKIYDVAAKHDVPVRWHPGSVNGGYERDPSTLLPDRRSIKYAIDLHLEYPEVPIIIDHGGVQGNWRKNVEESCNVAATYDNVYIEIGNYWSDLIKRPMNDPNIGADQLIWGTDWGASWIATNNPANRSTGEYDYPPQRWTQIKSRGLQAHQADAWGTSMRQIDKYAREVDLPADDLNLIMGGNICRLLDIEPPHKRLFPEYI